jgi:16S rRNA (guanine966-N2)-methyltransferase
MIGKPGGTIRIVAGKWRGRKLAVPDGDATRPTGERQRKALFDILGHGKFAPGGISCLTGARVLDAFAGTGALGLEALSRGAATCVFVEHAAPARRVLEANIRSLGAGPETRALAMDSTRPTAPPLPPFAPATLVFLDPPYRAGLAATALAEFAARGWLAQGAVCVIELAGDERLAPPAGFAAVDARGYGKTRFEFLTRET